MITNKQSRRWRIRQNRLMARAENRRIEMDRIREQAIRKVITRPNGIGVAGRRMGLIASVLLVGISGLHSYRNRL